MPRLLWWWRTRGCLCHWQKPYGRVVMMGCKRHDGSMLLSRRMRRGLAGKGLAD